MSNSHIRPASMPAPSWTHIFCLSSPRCLFPSPCQVLHRWLRAPVMAAPSRRIHPLTVLSKNHRLVWNSCFRRALPGTNTRYQGRCPFWGLALCRSQVTARSLGITYVQPPTLPILPRQSRRPPIIVSVRILVCMLPYLYSLYPIPLHT